MISLTVGSCATPPRTKTTEVVEIIVTPPAEKPRTTRPAPARPEIQTAAPKTWYDLSSLHEHQILDHKDFVIIYDNKFRLARWVKYEMTKEEAGAREAKRRNKFKPDPMLQGQMKFAVLPKEYKKTGYDQGHLAPSADFAYDQAVNDSTFVMSNMAPQKKNLNRQAWRLLEEQVRKWACGEEKITVVTGPVLEPDLDRLPGGLAIPRDFFKVVFDETPPRKAIAFVYHQYDSKVAMKDRLIDLKELDARIGENFSSYLENEERGPAQSNDWKECVP